MTLTFRWKLFLTFVLYGLILVFITQIVLLKINTDAIKSASLKNASLVFEEKNKRFKSYVNDVNLKILTFMNSSTFNEYLTNPNNLDLISSIFLDIANTSDDIMQLRYIDKNGMEKIRVDRDKTSSKLYIVDKKDLQNKSSRYYFNEILNTKKDDFWYSKVDLNMEQGIIEEPIKPVIRIGMPVYHNEKLDGILIINIFMINFLHELVDSPTHKLYIFDKNGDILVSSQHSDCWSKYLDKNYTIFTKFKEEADALDSSKEYLGDKIYANALFLKNSENLGLIIAPNIDYVQKEIDKSLNQLIWIMLLVILVSCPLSFLFSLVPIKLKKELLKQKKEQDVLLSLFDLSDTTLIKWNNDEHWSVASSSKSISKLIGYSQDDFLSNSISYDSLIHKDDIEQVQEEVKQAISDDVYFFTHSPYRIISKDGSVKWILDSTVLVKDKQDKLVSFVGYLSDISEVKNSEEKFRILSITDQLTNIFNRLHLNNALDNQKYRFDRNQEIFSIIIIDIDYFKSVNDEYGHLVGDNVLIEFAKLLQNSLRESDILGRWGGEEFLIILPHTNMIRAIQLANKLQHAIQEHTFSTIGSKTASFGVAAFEENMSIEKLIEHADTALYRAKDSGRNCVCATQIYKKP